MDRVICAKFVLKREQKTASLELIRPWDEQEVVFGVEKRCLWALLVVLLLGPMKCRRGIISD